MSKEKRPRDLCEFMKYEPPKPEKCTNFESVGHGMRDSCGDAQQDGEIWLCRKCLKLEVEKWQKAFSVSVELIERCELRDYGDPLSSGISTQIMMKWRKTMEDLGLRVRS